jgi:hypothetical protein
MERELIGQKEVVMIATTTRATVSTVKTITAIATTRTTVTPRTSNAVSKANVEIAMSAQAKTLLYFLNNKKDDLI